MNDLPERSQFQSRLPDEQSYWEGLAGRIADAAEPLLRERRESDAWWQPLEGWGPVIGVAAAAAALLVALAGPPATPQPTEFSFAELLGPDDPVGRALIGGAEISRLSTMLLVESGGLQ